MTRVLLAGTAGLLMSAAAACAGGLAPPIHPIAPLQAYAAPATCPVVQPVINALQAQGFTRIEVDTGATQARFAALRGDERHVFVYDCASGAVLDQEAERVAGGFAPGVVGVGQDNDSDFVVIETAASGGTGAGGVGTGADGDVGAGAGAGGDVAGGADGNIDTGGQVGGNTGVGVEGGVGVETGGDVGGDGGAGGGAGTGGEVDGGIGIDNGNRGGCDRSDLEGSENAPNDNCGGGNNTGGVDPDNPGAGEGAGRTGGVDSNGNGPGNGGLGGNGG